MTLQHENRIQLTCGKRVVREFHDFEIFEPAQDSPTEAEIRERAHEIYLDRNGAPGNAELDWLQAEMELRARNTITRSAEYVLSAGACEHR